MKCLHSSFVSLKLHQIAALETAMSMLSLKRVTSPPSGQTIHRRFFQLLIGINSKADWFLEMNFFFSSSQWHDSGHFHGAMTTVGRQCWRTLLVAQPEVWSVGRQYAFSRSIAFGAAAEELTNPERIIARWLLAKWHTNYCHFHFRQKGMSLVMCEVLIPFRAQTNAPVTFSAAKSLLRIGWACREQCHPEA